MFGVVVNYFFKEGYPSSVEASVRFALTLLKNCPEVTSIVLADGSAKINQNLKQYCELLSINYAHAGRQMSFGEAYNYGVSLLNEKWVAIMASDIYVYPDTFSKFRKFIENYKDLNIGCLIPYLSRCDLPLQQTSQFAKKTDSYASLMSFNLNVFKKEVFEKVGGMTTQYSGNFNDIDMSLKLKQLGLDIFLVGGSNVIHYGALTLRHGTNVDAKSDYEKFYEDHPEMYLPGGLWNLKVDQLLKHPILKLLYRLNVRFGRNPHQKQKRIRWVLRLIPSLQQIRSVEQTAAMNPIARLINLY
jgi:GT2 family glycosyltransferase